MSCRSLRRTASVGLTVTCLALSAASGARAEVVETSTSAFVVQETVTIAKPATVVYDALTSIGQWWDPAHSYSGQSSNLTLDARPGGCFCERLPGGGVEHMVVIYAEPGTMLRLRGGLGPLQSLAVTGVWTIALAEQNGQTKVEFTYAVSGFAKGGLGALAGPVDTVMGQQLAHLKQFAER